jgi:hypothetical protein
MDVACASANLRRIPSHYPKNATVLKEKAVVSRAKCGGIKAASGSGRAPTDISLPQFDFYAIQNDALAESGLAGRDPRQIGQPEAEIRGDEFFLFESVVTH